MSVRNRFSERKRVVLETSGLPDMAKQSFKDQCDINHIMGRYLKSGQLPLSMREPKYGYAEPTTFHEAMTVVAQAEQSFALLPSELRKRFHNDPKELLEFIHARNDEGELVNLDEMRKLGLAKPAVKEPEPTRVSIESTELERLVGSRGGAPGAAPGAATQ